MKFIPYEKLVLRTSLDLQEIRRRLAAGVGTPRGCGLAALKKPEKLFEGTVGENDFKFWRAIRHNNGFMPLIAGKIFPGKLEVELAWHPVVKIIMILEVILLGGLAWYFQTQLPSSTTFLAVAKNVPLLALALMIGLAVGSYNFYAGKAKEFLNSVVK